jgi:AraC family transcriptional regulator of adaptative response/methylated-DNA-[protein]-cysteine methyltransferase
LLKKISMSENGETPRVKQPMVWGTRRGITDPEAIPGKDLERTKAMNTDAATHLSGMLPTEQDPRWQSVVNRDPAADGQFFYSVRTSGVYCFPSCAARLAKPENVQFHPTREAAEQAGFRPCKRCKPNLGGGARQQAAEAIRFAIAESVLGLALVAESSLGLCAVLLGDDAEALRNELQARFPAATLTEGDASLAAPVVAALASPQRPLETPLDLRGTQFQQQVWQALCKIPVGTTVSYTEIAQQIGVPKGVRAVAQACAANPVAVLVPCHRVVKSDGQLSGYRWGVARKQALLEQERAV